MLASRGGAKHQNERNELNSMKLSQISKRAGLCIWVLIYATMGEGALRAEEPRRPQFRRIRETASPAYGFGQGS